MKATENRMGVRQFGYCSHYLTYWIGHIKSVSFYVLFPKQWEFKVAV